MPRIERNLGFVDTETTGLDESEHEILQIAIIITDPSAKNILETYEARIKPLHIEKATPKALQVNGYKEADYADELCAPRDVVASNILRLMKDVVPVGHNVSFDLGMIKSFLTTLGLEPNWHYHKVCTMNLAWPMFCRKEIDYFNLDTLCTYFGIPRPKIHRAKEDIEATREVYLKIMEKLV